MCKKKITSLGSEGFTLIELLVVLVIVGILGLVSSPIIGKQISKAKSVEAKQTIRVYINKQMAIYYEKGSFASSLGELSIPEEGNYYNFMTIEYSPSDERGGVFACISAVPKSMDHDPFNGCASSLESLP